MRCVLRHVESVPFVFFYHAMSTMYCVLWCVHVGVCMCSVYCVLCIRFRVLCFVLLCLVDGLGFCIVICVLRMVYCVSCIGYHVMSTMHCVLWGGHVGCCVV